LEGISLDNDYRPSQVQNATILLILVGALDIYLGFQSFHLSIIIPNPFQTIVGTLMLVFGVLTLCTSLIAWLQKPWATKIIAGVGITVVVTLVLLGVYLIALILFAPIYWVAINWIRASQPTEIPDWVPDWHED
jgi:hypothetical protein